MINNTFNNDDAGINFIGDTENIAGNLIPINIIRKKHCSSLFLTHAGNSTFKTGLYFSLVFKPNVTCMTMLVFKANYYVRVI